MWGKKHPPLVQRRETVQAAEVLRLTLNLILRCMTVGITEPFLLIAGG